VLQRSRQPQAGARAECSRDQAGAGAASPWMMSTGQWACCAHAALTEPGTHRLTRAARAGGARRGPRVTTPGPLASFAISATAS